MSLPDNLFDSMRPEFASEIGVNPDFKTSASILVVTGQNAAGKSLLRRYLQMTLKRDYEMEVIHLSQEGRSTGGIERAFIYGSEGYESTGAMTAKTFIVGMKTMRKRERPHVVIWDEPEIGMGDELQLGTANWFCSQLEDWPEHLQGIVLLTHSRYFVRRVMEFPGARWLSLDGIKTPEAWLDREIVPVDPETVLKTGHERFRRVSKILGRDDA